MYLVYDTYSLILLSHLALFFFFFFNDTATTEIYTLSLHDALPISAARDGGETRRPSRAGSGAYRSASGRARAAASPGGARDDGRSGRPARGRGPHGGRSRAAARPRASSRRAPRSTPRGRSRGRAISGPGGGGPPWSAPSARSPGSRACDPDRSGPTCRRGRRGQRCRSSERLPPRVPLVEAVPVTDLAFTVLPAEVDLATVAQVREVHQAEPQVLRPAAELHDLLERLAHPFGQLLDPPSVRAPLRPVHDATAGQRDPRLLGPKALAQRGGLRMSGHRLAHERRERGDQRLHLARREVAISHGSTPRRRSRAPPSARARRA